MQIAPDPMQSFKIGQEIGKADSPVTGIGLAIQNVVDDARKKGLLKAEQDYKTQGAIDAAEATLPAEFSKMKYQSDLDTQKGQSLEGFKTQGAIDVAEGTEGSKINVLEAQAAAQGKATGDNQLEAFNREQNINEGYEFEDPENPAMLTVEGFPKLIRVDKKVGDKYVKQYEDARGPGFFERSDISKSTKGIQTLKEVNLAERGKGTKESPYLIESEAEIDSLGIKKGAWVLLNGEIRQVLQ